MASIMLLQTAGLIGFAHGFRPYLSTHKRWIPICCGKRSACDLAATMEIEFAWIVACVASDGWLHATWHNQTSGMWSIKPNQKKEKTSLIEYGALSFYTHYLNFFCIKIYLLVVGDIYKWNKEFLKERGGKKNSNLYYYKVNFAQKENILKAQKCWIISPLARNMWQIEYLVPGLHAGWSAVHKCTQMVSCSMITKLRWQNLTKLKFPFG